jgi:hypothetical protein
LRKAALSKIISLLVLSERALKPLCAMHFSPSVQDKGPYLGEKCLKRTFSLIVKLFWRAKELTVVKCTHGPKRPSSFRPYF